MKWLMVVLMMFNVTVGYAAVTTPEVGKKELLIPQGVYNLTPDACYTVKSMINGITSTHKEDFTGMSREDASMLGDTFASWVIQKEFGSGRMETDPELVVLRMISSLYVRKIFPELVKSVQEINQKDFLVKREALADDIEKKCMAVGKFDSKPLYRS